MKCLTYDESSEWFASMDIKVDGNRNILLPIQLEKMMTTMPKRASNLNFLSDRLVQWFSPSLNRIIWFSHWQTYPWQLIPFEKMRFGCGETRTLIEAPGHLFESSTEEENAIMAGLIFLVMAFNWSAYILTENCKDYIYLGDEYIIFANANNKKLKKTSQLISDYKLEVIKDIKEVWK